jgi:exo-beta-1,3-glucanase (GH17 family)/cellulose synthase/poly-beta-1,6-N-acetylglucosamine synthase-like glycosyltransferase
MLHRDSTLAEPRGRALFSGSQPQSVASMRVVVGVVALVACVHAGLWSFTRHQASAPDFDRQLPSISYAPYAGSGHPDRGNRPTAARIRADLKIIAPYTRAIRTYSSTGGVELVPEIANEFGLKVTVGAWIDRDEARNEREIRAALDLAKKNRNVIGIVVGNETIYRGEKTVPELMQVIQRVKRESKVPVTTGEIWSVWADHPELASSVDYIAAHILPYWEGISEKSTVDVTIEFYDRLRRIHPGKRIVVAEFGWPSAGYNRRAANPGRIEQATVLRDFVTRAEAMGIDYNIIEATDQPWKTFEGSVGPYWGLFDANRQPKFAWTGPITDSEHWKLAGIAVLLGFLLSLPVLRIAGATAGQSTLLVSAAHGVGAWGATVFSYWTGHYFVVGAAIALGVGVLLLVPLIIIALARVDEIAAIAFGRRDRRLLAPAAAPADFAPKVSIHIPAYREPPEMLKQTLDAVARLEYPNFECVIVINNTPDPAFWQPIAEHCAALGDRFKFVCAEQLAGFKAGALRLALSHTAADAEIIGVLDADYTVHPDWLKDLVPAFADPTVGLIQAPQDHRDADRSPMHHALNGEYAGFFDIGMVERNERNAIIVHGTMCLIRRAALEAAGSWSSDTIVEDADLGLTLLELGWRAHYTTRRYGHGLLPDSFEAYKKQRHRWAYGGVQIIRKHWRRFLPGTSRLTSDQKREYAVGWLNWLGAESVGVVVAFLNLIWVPVVAFIGIAVPDKVLTWPIMAAFIVTMLHFLVAYRSRVAIPLGQTMAAALAAMAVQWTVAKAVGDGVIRDRLPFARTAKGGATCKSVAFPALCEAALGSALLLGAVIVYATNWERVREVYFFAAVLLIQSLPFLAAAGLALLENSRMNSFAYWQTLPARLADLLPRRGPAVAKAPAAVENRVETVQ